MLIIFRILTTESEVVFIPLDGFLKALGKIVIRGISQQAARLGDVRVGMLDVALAVRSEDRLDINAERFRKRMVNVKQIFSSAVSDITSPKKS